MSDNLNANENLISYKEITEKNSIRVLPCQ